MIRRCSARNDRDLMSERSKACLAEALEARFHAQDAVAQHLLGDVEGP